MVGAILESFFPKGKSLAYVVAAIWKAKVGEELRIHEVIKIIAPETRKEPGNLIYQAQVSSVDPTKFFLYEQYRTAKDYDAHKASDYFQKHVIGYAIQYLDAREVTTYETIDV